MSLRILHIFPRFLPERVGGSEVYGCSLLTRLQAQGFEVAVLCRRATTRRAAAGPYAIDQYEGLTLYGVAQPLRPSRRQLLAQFAWPVPSSDAPAMDRAWHTLLAAWRPQLVHLHQAGETSGALLGLIHAAGVPMVMTLHDLSLMCLGGSKLRRYSLELCTEMPDCGVRCLESLLPVPRCPSHTLLRAACRGFFWYTRLRRAALTKALAARRDALLQQLHFVDRFIAPSLWLRDQHIAWGVNPARIVHMDYGTDVGRFASAQPKTPAHRLRFGFLGRAMPDKGIHLVIEAFRSLRGRAELDLYAVPPPGWPGYVRYLRAMAVRVGARFRPPVEPHRVAEVLRQIDVLVVPSIWPENSPLVIHEAFASGTAVIAPDAGGARELVRPRCGGLLFRSGDAADLARTMRRVVEEPGLLDALRQRLPSVKTMDAHAQELIGLYEALCANGRGARVSSS